MDDREAIILAGLDVTNDTVRAFQDFPNLAALELRDDASGQRKFADLLGSSGQAVDDSESVSRRIPSEVGVDSAQMIEGSVRPVNLHFLSPKPARTCSTSFVRPA